MFQSVRVSNELGAGNPQAASLAVQVVLSIAFIEGIFLASTMILLRNIWGHVYSNDKEVISYMSAMMPILAISSFLDGIQSALSGTPHTLQISYLPQVKKSTREVRILFVYRSSFLFFCQKISNSRQIPPINHINTYWYGCLKK